MNAFTGDPAANNQIAYAVENEFKQDTALFDPKTTGLSGNLTPDEPTRTFTFSMTVTLAKVLAKIAKDRININYVYATGCACKKGCDCYAVIGAPDLKKVEKAWKAISR